jgi:hypothetical protein
MSGNEIRSCAGGGLQVASGNPVDVRANRILNNRALEGGGVYCMVGSCVIRDNVIKGNRAGQRGGGLLLSSTDIQCRGNTIGANSASRGDRTQLIVSLSAPATVEVVIYNLAGRPVASLRARDLPAGLGTLLWDGRSVAGTSVPAGGYLARVTARTADGLEARAPAAVSLTR